MTYIEEVLSKLNTKYFYEKEFLQASKEVLESLKDVVSEHEDFYRKNLILERLTTPDRIISFKVVWKDDKNNFQINNGYRVQFNNCLGPYKGGLRFHPSVNQSILKFLGFEQVFKNALTGLPLGGGKGGSDFDPKGKSDTEIMSFCQAFMSELYKYIGPDIDVPAGDIGVGGKEIGYLFGQYKKLTNSFHGVLTGKGISYSGLLGRKQATGYGLLYITKALLESKNISLKGKTCVVSGAGNVAIYAIEKAQQLGMKVITCSDSNGYIVDENGIDLDLVKKLKEVERKRISEYVKYHPEASYFSGKGVFKVKADIVLPCACQNEFDLEDAKACVNNKVICILEGANMPLTIEAINYIKENGIMYIPGKASNAGGVAASGIEMSQNSYRQSFSFEDVDRQLEVIMRNIFNNISLTANKYNKIDDYMFGANVTGFFKVVEALIEQGI